MSEALLLVAEGYEQIAAGIRKMVAAQKDTSKKEENLEAVENFKGSRLEKLAVLYCKQLGINYKNLSDEEFRWLIRILQKSKKTGTPINQEKTVKENRCCMVCWIPCSSGLCCGYYFIRFLNIRR